MARHGGGVLSARIRPRSTARPHYAARYVAKNIVAAGLADKCEVQVSYAIGVAEPTSISVTTFGTGKVGDDVIEKLIRAHFDLRPYGITRMLDLEHPITRPPRLTATSAASRRRSATSSRLGPQNSTSPSTRCRA